MDKSIPWLSSEVYDSDLAAGEAEAEAEREAEADEDTTFWDSLIFPI